MISACVISYNEENSIERCLKSLSFADEIIVVDSCSKDKTVQIAQKLAHKVLQKEWKGFAEQRNFCLENSKGNWVFFLDADEEASSHLAEKLKEIASLSAESQPECYSIKRVEYFLGKELLYGPGNPSHQWRFFQRKKVSFKGGVHEYPVFQGPVGMIDSPIYHWPHLGVDRFLNKLNHYTTLEALDRFKLGQKTSLFHAFGTFFTTFLKNGIRYRGFLNGKEGFILVLLESISRVVRHLKLWVFWEVYEGRIKLNLGFSLPEPGSGHKPARSELERPVWKPQQ